MKTTDSVMREFKELLHNTSVSDSDLLDFFSDSLAEARREWVEEMVKKIDKLQTQCNEADGLIDGITALHTLRSNLLTGDNPEEAK